MGLRIVSGVALAATVMALALTPAASAQDVKRTVYKVYFDWGVTTLDARASEAVAKALKHVKQCEYNGVRVVGHADTSHTAEESSRLASERAKSVRAALMKLGIADGAISWTGHNEIDPEIPTADGVKEPKNRRVEIIVVCD